MSEQDPELLFPAWRQRCLDDALDLVDRVLFGGGSGATQPGLRPSWQERLRASLLRSPRSEAPPTDLGLMDSLSGVSLMSDDAVSENILSRRLVQALDHAAEWPLRELATRCTVWRWHIEQAGFASPVLLEPATLAETLTQALGDCVPYGPRRQDLLTELTPALVREVPPLYERQADWLEQHGLGPMGALRRPAADRPPARPPQAPVPIQPTQVPALLARLAEQAGMSAGMRRVMQQLAGPVQRSVQADPQLLANGDNTLWRMVDRLASLAQLDADQPSPGRPTLDQRLAPLVKALIESPQPLGATQYAQALTHAERLAMAALPNPASAAPRDARQLELEARRAELEPLIQFQLADRLRTLQLVPAVRQFLLGPWVQVMAHSSAVDGVDGPAAQRWASLVDALIAAAERQRPRPLGRAELDCLALEARDGLLATGQSPARAAQHEAELRQELARWPRVPPSPAPAGTGSADAASVAEPDDSAPDSQPFSDDMLASDWAHHADLSTVPIALDDTPDSPAWRDREQWLAGLAEGDMCRVFLQGRWTAVRLDWVSDRQQFYAFSRRIGTPFCTSRRVLERMRNEGLITTIPPGQWLRDAVDSLSPAL